LSLAFRAWAFGALALLSGLQLGRHDLRPGPRSWPLFVATALAGLALARGDRARERPEAAPAPPRSRGRTWAFRAAAVLLAWLGLEGVLWAGVHVAPQELRRAGLRRTGDGTPDREELRTFLAERFDPELGWDRSGRVPRPGPRPFATSEVSAFGDSFVACVGPDEETWETHLGARLGTNVVNQGVPAYGPDQALLKLRRDLSCHPTRVVLLGILSENVCRIQNVYRLAYTSLHYKGALRPDGTIGWEPTKPRFVRRGERLETVPNPVRGARDLERLLADPRGFLAPVERHDRFAAGYDLEHVFPTVSFPYTATIPLGLLRRSRVASEANPATELLRGGEGLALLDGIVEAFFQDVGRAGSMGLVVLFGWPDDYEHERETGAPLRLGPLRDLLDRKGLPYVDTVAEMVRHVGSLTPSPSEDPLYDASWHLTPYANRLVADALASRVRPYLDPAGAR